MAVDTAQKRRSMISFGDALNAERVPEATNFDSAFDRGAALFLYAGLDITTVVVSTVPVRCTPYIRPLISATPTIGALIRPTVTLSPS